ncbi:hypothetical protein MHH60_14245 [Paenibacillus sp. FSL H7-0716]|uniref:HNH endonuclease 5 domain-containing protein n=1 Tax=Paenibacillus odorifer TaxID=189426 RepID=A0AB36JKD8_9BACL|nr:hypothetical protein [Paenibacillus odorifer]OME23532.1 hypothetical protein BSK47_03490 [Paenibacillus odorifer]
MSYHLVDIIQHRIAEDRATHNDQKLVIQRFNKQCIFCGSRDNDFPEEHLLPEGLGNNTYFTKNMECKVCNEIISVHEGDLVRLLELDRILALGDKKKGNPKFKKSSESPSYIVSDKGLNRVYVGIDQSENHIKLNISNDLSLGALTITNRVIRLVGICKALTHMGWPFLIDQFSKLTYIPSWLINKLALSSLNLEIIQAISEQGTGIPVVQLEIWEHEDTDSEFPYLISYYYGFTVVQFYLPKKPDINTVPEWQGSNGLRWIKGESEYETRITCSKIFNVREDSCFTQTLTCLFEPAGVNENTDGSIYFKQAKTIQIIREFN